MNQLVYYPELHSWTDRASMWDQTHIDTLLIDTPIPLLFLYITFWQMKIAYFQCKCLVLNVDNDAMLQLAWNWWWCCWYLHVCLKIIWLANKSFWPIFVFLISVLHAGIHVHASIVWWSWQDRQVMKKYIHGHIYVWCTWPKLIMYTNEKMNYLHCLYMRLCSRTFYLTLSSASHRHGTWTSL